MGQRRATHPGEDGLGLVGASAVQAVGNRVIDTVHLAVSVQAVPTGGFVGMDHRTRRDMRADHRDRSVLVGGSRRKGPAFPFAGDDDGLPFGWIVISRPNIDPIGLDVGLLGVTTNIHPIDLNRAPQDHGVPTGANGFLNFVSHYERRLVLHV